MQTTLVYHPDARTYLHALWCRYLLCYARVLSAWGERFPELLYLPNSYPSEDTITRVFQRIAPKSLLLCLQEFNKSILPSLEGKLVSIDGKRIRGSRSKSGSTHMVLSEKTE